jgi:hypothetical protein
VKQLPILLRKVEESARVIVLAPWISETWGSKLNLGAIRRMTIHRSSLSDIAIHIDHLVEALLHSSMDDC